MSVKIIVATHKKYIFTDSNTYTPIQVGSALNQHEFGYLLDNSDKSISDKNGSFCELTALYWAWKNSYFVKHEYCGLAHYRRYFSGTLPFNGLSILSESEILKLMQTYDVILPKKRHYYIETVREHYNNAHYTKDLDALAVVVQQLYPEYMQAFDTVMNKRSIHLYNMFVMRPELYEQYCTWLFSILFELETRLDVTEYSSYQQRVFGFLSERLFNIWIKHNDLKVLERKVVFLEKEARIKKAINMLKRKYLT